MLLVEGAIFELERGIGGVMTIQGPGFNSQASHRNK